MDSRMDDFSQDGEQVDNDSFSPPMGKVELPANIKFDKSPIPVFDGPINYAQVNTKPKPTSGETVSGAFKDVSEANTLSTFTGDLKYKNPFSDVPPEGWSPKDEADSFAGINPKYMGFVLKGTSPMDVKNRASLMFDRQLADENWRDGSTFLKLVGSLGGAATNLTSYFPMARAAKYLSTGETLLYNIQKMFPSIAASSVAHEAWQNTMKQGGNLEDFLVNSAIDTVAGTVFIGGALGLSEGVAASHLWDVRKTMKFMYDGIETKPIVQADGTVSGFKAHPMEGQNVSAAKVDFAQQFLDSEMAKKGLFKVPVLAGLLGKGTAAINPIVRGLNSRFETIRAFTNSIASHGIETKGITEGRASPDKFDEHMTKIRGENSTLMSQYEGYYMERLGINPVDTRSDAINQTGQWTQKKIAKMKDGYVNPEEFGGEVQSVITEGQSSQHTSVNQAAEMYMKETKNIYSEYRAQHGFEEKWLDPKTAENYLSRVYVRDQVLTEKDKWVDTIFKEVKDGEAQIDARMNPINDYSASVKEAKAAHDALINSPGATDDLVSASAKELKAKQTRLKLMKEKVQDELRENPSLRMLVDDVHALSAKEAKTLKKITKPLRNYAKDMEAKKSLVDSKKKEIYFLENKRDSAKNKKQAKDISLKVKELQKEVETLKEEHRLAKDKHDIEEDKLQEMAMSGKISPTLFRKIPNSERVKFKNPNDRLKFNEKFESDFHIRNAAEATRNTILNQTNEETLNEVLNHLTGNRSENPLKNRTLMVPDKALYDAGFLSKNIGLNLANYRIALGRKIALKKTFGDLSVNGGIQPITDRLTTEYHNQFAGLGKKQEIPKDASEKDIKRIEKENEKLKKEQRALTKEFDQAKEYMQLSYNRMMGRNRLSNKQRVFSNVARTFASMVKLGFVPLLMTTDVTSIIFKHGLWPSIRDGLLPTLKSLNGLVKTEDASLVRANAAHAHLANNHLTMGYSDRNWSGVTEQHVPLQGKLENGLEKLATISNNFSLSNYIENWLQRWTATVVQSMIVKSMQDFEKGALKDSDLKKLLFYGMDPKDWSKRVLEGWRSRGSDGNGFGGYQSRYWEWADAEASNKMAFTIMKATKDTIVRRGMMDAPFFTDSSLWGTLYATFKGWTFASGTRYLLPLMQNPDPEKLIGMVLMMGVGSMQDPLYRVARGEDAFEGGEPDTEKLFWSAITNSGVFSVPAEGLQELNQVFGGKLIPGITNERYRDRSVAGIAAGPIGGVANDLIRLIQMAGSGNFNENDMKKVVTMLPFSGSIWLRGLSNKWIESQDLPKTYGQAAKGS